MSSFIIKSIPITAYQNHEEVSFSDLIITHVKHYDHTDKIDSVAFLCLVFFKGTVGLVSSDHPFITFVLFRTHEIFTVLHQKIYYFEL